MGAEADPGSGASGRHAPDPSPLLRPRSVAVVGANERAGSYGDVIFRNLAAVGFEGDAWAFVTGQIHLIA